MGGIPLHIGPRFQYWGVEIFQYWTPTDLIAVLVVFGETGKSPKKQYFFSACSVAISPHQMLVVGGVPHDDDIEAHRLTVDTWLIFGLYMVNVLLIFGLYMVNILFSGACLLTC